MAWGRGVSPLQGGGGLGCLPATDAGAGAEGGRPRARGQGSRGGGASPSVAELCLRSRCTGWSRGWETQGQRPEGAGGRGAAGGSKRGRGAAEGGRGRLRGRPHTPCPVQTRPEDARAPPSQAWRGASRPTLGGVRPEDAALSRARELGETRGTTDYRVNLGKMLTIW